MRKLTPMHIIHTFPVKDLRLSGIEARVLVPGSIDYPQIIFHNQR